MIVPGIEVFKSVGVLVECICGLRYVWGGVVLTLLSY